MAFIVAIDGPGGSGKGTITKIISKKLGLVNIDTGAMYRCVTLKCLENNINEKQVEEIEKILEMIKIEIKRNGEEQKIYLNGEDVSEKIRTFEVDNLVAEIATVKCVREKLTNFQRKMGASQNIIMEGRDIGTAVFPNADIKIYLDASLEERAMRRYKQNIEKGIKCEYQDVLNNIAKRQELTENREIAPLRKAEDAIYIDTSDMQIEQVVEKIIKSIEEKGYKG